MALKLMKFNFSYISLNDFLLLSIPENFPVFPVRNDGHLGCDCLLESLVNITTGLLS